MFGRYRMRIIHKILSTSLTGYRNNNLHIETLKNSSNITVQTSNLLAIYFSPLLTVPPMKSLT